MAGLWNSRWPERVVLAMMVAAKLPIPSRSAYWDWQQCWLSDPDLKLAGVQGCSKASGSRAEVSHRGEPGLEAVLDDCRLLRMVMYGVGVPRSSYSASNR